MSAHAVVACMDPRLSGRLPEEAYAFRNGGGVVTDDALRSLAIAVGRGVDRIDVYQHTDCAAGIGDPDASVARAVDRLRAEYGDAVAVRGFVYDVDTRELREVTVGRPASAR